MKANQAKRQAKVNAAAQAGNAIRAESAKRNAAVPELIVEGAKAKHAIIKAEAAAAADQIILATDQRQAGDKTMREVMLGVASKLADAKLSRGIDTATGLHKVQSLFLTAFADAMRVKRNEGDKPSKSTQTLKSEFGTVIAAVQCGECVVEQSTKGTDGKVTVKKVKVPALKALQDVPYYRGMLAQARVIKAQHGIVSKRGNKSNKAVSAATLTGGITKYAGRINADGIKGILHAIFHELHDSPGMVQDGNKVFLRAFKERTFLDLDRVLGLAIIGGNEQQRTDNLPITADQIAAQQHITNMGNGKAQSASNVIALQRAANPELAQAQDTHTAGIVAAVLAALQAQAPQRKRVAK